MTTHKVEPDDSLNDAVSALNPGDRLLLRAGVYDQAVTVNVSGKPGMPITLAAYRSEPVSWTSPNGTTTLDIRGDYVNARRITFDKQYRSGIAVRMRGNRGFLAGSRVRHCRYYTMIRVDGDDCKINNNVIFDNQYGKNTDAHAIMTRGGIARLTLFNNTIFDVTGDCFQAEAKEGPSVDLKIIKNEMYTTLEWRSENGIDIKAGSGRAARNNIHSFRDCPGQDVPPGTPGSWGTGNSGAGILIHDLSDGWVVANNNLWDNTMGVRVIDSRAKNVRIYSNHIADIAFNDPNAWLAVGVQIARATGVSIIKNVFDVEKARAIKIDPADLPVIVRGNTYGG